VTQEQYEQLVREVYTPMYRGVFALMYQCGLRVGEAVALRPCDVDGNELTVRVIGKGNKERLAPLPAGLLLDLRKVWVQHHCREWLFPNQSHQGPILPVTLQKVFRVVRCDLGWSESLTPHSLRHGFATRLFEQDVAAETIAILLGHASAKTTKRYLHLTEAVRAQVKDATASLYVPLFD
jgi:integrase/recombinase XerD